MDDVDITDIRMEADRQSAIKAAQDAAKTRQLQPIFDKLEGGRIVSLCHHCESPILAGHVFCPVDTERPEESCSAIWERDRLRRGVLR